MYYRWSQIGFRGYVIILVVRLLVILVGILVLYLILLCFLFVTSSPYVAFPSLYASVSSKSRFLLEWSLCCSPSDLSSPDTDEPVV